MLADTDHVLLVSYDADGVPTDTDVTGIWKVPVTPPYPSPPGARSAVPAPPAARRRGAGTRPLLARHHTPVAVLAGGRTRCRCTSRRGSIRPAARCSTTMAPASTPWTCATSRPSAPTLRLGTLELARVASGSTPNRGEWQCSGGSLITFAAPDGLPAGPARDRAARRTTSRPTPRCGRWSDVSWPGRDPPARRRARRRGARAAGRRAACTTSSTRSWRGAADLPESVRAAADDARAAVAADERWRHLVAALGVGPHEVELLALLAAVRARPAADPGARLPRRLRGAGAAVAGRRGAAVGLAARSPAGPGQRAARWQLAGPDGPWQATTPWTVDADVAAYLAGCADWPAMRRDAVPLDVVGRPCLQPVRLAEMRGAAARVDESRLRGRTGRPVRVGPAHAAGPARRRPRPHRRGDQPGRRHPRPAHGAAARRRPALGRRRRAPGRGGRDARRTHPRRPRDARRSTQPPGVVRLSWPMPATGVAQRAALWSGATTEEAPRLVTDWDLTPADVAHRRSRGRRRPDRRVPRAAQPAAPRDVRADDAARPARTTGTTSWSPSTSARSCSGCADQVRLRRRRARRLGVPPAVPGAPRASPRCSPGRAAPARRWPHRCSPARSTSTCYRVDLAEVVSKYIGETEKQLARVFDECEREQRAGLLRRGRRAVRAAHPGAGRA